MRTRLVNRWAMKWGLGPGPFLKQAPFHHGFRSKPSIFHNFSMEAGGYFWVQQTHPRLFFTVPRMGYGRPLSSTAAADVETLQVAGGGAPVPRGWSFGVPWRLVLVFFLGGGSKFQTFLKDSGWFFGFFFGCMDFFAVVVFFFWEG